MQLVHPDGTGRKQLGKTPQTKYRLTRFSPAGREVLSIESRTAESGTETSVVILDIETGDRRVLAHRAGQPYPVSACWSADGAWVAYSFGKMELSHLQVIEGDLELIRAGGTEHRQLDLPSPVWSVADWR